MKVKELFEQAQQLFAKRGMLMSLWQEQAENFYPERADFTYRRTIGTDFASFLSTSYPILSRRELADQVGTMLRPTAKEWFHMGVVDSDKLDNDARRWLQWAAQTQRRAMYDMKTRYTRASKEVDNDFATFGQGVMQVHLNRTRDAFFYRSWHLRDCAWLENADGDVMPFFRKWKPTARDLTQLFKGHVSPKVTTLASKEPFTEIECMHMVVEMDMWDDVIDSYDRTPDGITESRRPASGAERRRYPYISVHYDTQNDHIMEARAVYGKEYVVPRWQTVSGSQYAFSPATVAALPEARLLQAMVYTILEAGEKAVNPPMVATMDAVRSDIAIYAGGETWVDRDYDERLGEALRPLTQDFRGIPQGNILQQDSRQMIAAAFYLNKLTLPQRAPEMTAYEVGQRIQEYIRGALPLFEPMEYDYSGAVCEETFTLGLRSSLFGSPYDMPKSLSGRAIKFMFQSPLHDAIEAQLGQKFLESKALLADAAALDPSSAAIIDVKVALRDALNGTGTPAKWLRSEQDVQAAADALKAQQQSQALLGTLQQGATVAKTLGEAKQGLAEPLQQAA